MRVIGAGLGRTGTLSLKAALQRVLGGRCYHMAEVFRHPDHADLWLRVARGEPVDLAAMLEGYEATVDWPGCVFWRELVDAAPDALVLLSVRPAAQWYESFHETIHRTLLQSPAEAAESGIPANIHELGQVVVRDRTFGPGLAGLDRSAIIAAYERHNDEVRSGVPADRLLEYDVTEGWGPLCAFLGVPVPDEPFPVRNDRDRFRDRFGLTGAGSALE